MMATVTQCPAVKSPKCHVKQHFASEKCSEELKTENTLYSHAAKKQIAEEVAYFMAICRIAICANDLTKRDARDVDLDLMMTSKSLIFVGAHFCCSLLRFWCHDHDASVVDVKDVVLVHNPPAEDLGSILSEPPAERPTPDEDLQHVRWALNETLSLDAVWVRFWPEHGKACGASDCESTTDGQDWCWLHHEEPVASSTGGEK